MSRARRRAVDVDQQPADGRRASPPRSPRCPCRLRSRTKSAACAPACRAAPRRRIRARSWPAPRPAGARPCSRRCVMPRIWPATFSASSGVLASLMPPALPRLPVGTCAFTTHGPICAAAIAASFALMHSMPRGTAMPAGARISAFAACSSKFITCRISSSRRRTAASSLGLSSGMVVTRWVMLRKFL